MNNKAQYKGIVIVAMGIILLFGVAFASFFTYHMLDELKPDMITEFQINNNTEAITAINDVHNRFPGTWDALIVTVFFLLWAFLTVAAFMANEHPAFLILMVVIAIFVLIAAIMLGNFYEDMFEDETISSIKISFPMTNWILSHMLIITLVLSVSVIVGLYTKNVMGG